MKRLAATLLGLTPLLVMGCSGTEVIISPAYYENPPKRIAVLPFESFAEEDKLLFFGLAGFTEKGKAGEVVSAQITKELMRTGLYYIVEREQLKSIFDERTLMSSDILMGENLAKIKQILGVDVVIVGGVTEMEEGGSPLFIWATVEGHCRMVDVTTGTVLWTASLGKGRVWPFPLVWVRAHGRARAAAREMAQQLKRKTMKKVAGD